MSWSDVQKSRVAVSLIFAVNGFLYANWVARLPRLQEIYQLDHGQLGLVLLAGSIGALVAMPLTGSVIVKAGSHRITVVMLFIFCLLVPLIPITPNVYTLWLILFAIGASSGSLDVAMNAQAVLVEQRLHKPVMSSFHAIFSAGMMLGAGCGALFVYLNVSYFTHLLIVMAISLVVALRVRHFLIPDLRNPSEEPQDHVSKNVFLHPALLSLGLIAFCCMLGEGAMADWTAIYMEKVSLADRDWSPLGLVAFSTAMMIGRLLGDGARQRLGDSRLVQGSAVVAIAGLSLALVWPVVWTGILGFFLVGIGLAAIVPIAYSTAGNIPGLSPGVGISMVTSIGYAGFLVGPPVIGFLSDWQGLRFGMAFVLLLFLTMLILNIFAVRRQRKVRIYPEN
ncbi:MFS transporter [Lewinella sp. LCG006]|uniref:MFS transporter n=1 Tax=Lewinella sp. LCG006 TaxID=3231911 RepID=UPI00345FA71F